MLLGFHYYSKIIIRIIIISSFYLVVFIFSVLPSVLRWVFLRSKIHGLASCAELKVMVFCVMEVAQNGFSKKMAFGFVIIMVTHAVHINWLGAGYGMSFGFKSSRKTTFSLILLFMACFKGKFLYWGNMFSMRKSLNLTLLKDTEWTANCISHC